MPLSAETVTAGTEQAGGDTSALATAPDDTAAGATPQGSSQAGDPESEAAAIELLGQDQYNSIKDDPKQLAKALHKSYTTKMQTLSSRSDFIKAFEEDPEGTLTRFARGMGLDVQKPKTDGKTEAATKLAEAIGEEGAQLLQPFIKAIVDESVADIKKGQETLEMEAANEAANALVERFTAKYPGWKQYEKAMEAIGEDLVPNIKPGKAVDEFVYMERLYQLAKGAGAVGDEVERHNERVTASARAGAKPAAGVHSDRVAPSPGGKMNFDEVWANSKKGIAFDPADVMDAKRAEWKKQKAARGKG